jgi:hypothetical protein
MIEPLPFKLSVPDDDKWEGVGHESREFKVDGLLHLEQGVLVLEYAVRETVQRFGFEGVGTDRNEYPAEVVEIPVEWISDIRITDLILFTWITLRARRLDTFEGIPGAGPGRLTLRVSYPNRHLMKPLVVAIEKARQALPYRAPAPTRALPPAADEQTPLP